MQLSLEQLKAIARAQLSPEELFILRLLVSMEPPDVALVLGFTRQYVHLVKNRAESKIKLQGLEKIEENNDSQGEPDYSRVR